MTPSTFRPATYYLQARYLPGSEESHGVGLMERCQVADSPMGWDY